MTHVGSLVALLSGIASSLALVLLSGLAIAQDFGSSLFVPASEVARLAKGDSTAVWAVYLLTAVLAALGATAAVLGRAVLRRWEEHESHQTRAIAAITAMNTTTQSMVTAAFLTARAAGAGEVPPEVAAFMEETSRALREQRESLQHVFSSQGGGSGGRR